MYFDGKCIVIITGASRGLGRAIASALVDEVPEGSKFLLLARSLNDLEETKSLLTSKKKLQVIVAAVDNESASKETFEACLDDALRNEEDIASFQSALLVHNAGSLGPQGKPVRDSIDLAELQQYFSGNLFSVMMLTSAFMSRFTVSTTRLIINISSLAAMEPFETWSYYCMGKSARDMLFRVMATEEKEDKKLRILNYAPGPLDTAMVQEVMTSSSTHANILSAFEKMKSKDQLLTPDESAAKLVKLLTQNKFKNGDHVDYFEVE